MDTSVLSLRGERVSAVPCHVHGREGKGKEGARVSSRHLITYSAVYAQSQ